MADSPQPPDQPPARREPLLGRLLEAGARTGGRVAEATGIDQAIEDVAADAVVRALESPAAERAIAQALESAAVERSINRAIDSEMIDRVWERLLASDEVQKLVERIAEAPEIRNAIAAQGFGLIDDIGAQVGRIARHVDSIVERVARAIFRKPRREGEAKQAGLFSRALAMGIDAVIVNVIFLGLSALTALLVQAVFDPGDGFDAPALVVGSLAWALISSTYLVFFWGLSGETPGMRFLDLRLSGPDGPRLGFRRALRRLVGGVLGLIPLGLGFWIALFGEERRTYADRRAETEMLYLPPRSEAPGSRAPEPARL